MEGALRTVGRLAWAEGGAEHERRLQAIVVDPHERVAEPVDAAVAPVAGGGVRANGGRLTRLPGVDRRRNTRHEPVREAGAAPWVVALGQQILQIGKRRPPLEGIRPAHRVHDAVTAREQKAALAPDSALDRSDRRPGIVPVGHDRLEAANPAVLDVIAQEATALGEVDCDRPLHLLPASAEGKQPDRYSHRGQARKREQDQTSGPPWWRAARWIVRLSYGWMTNFFEPVDLLPLMSVASHLNVVVWVMWNTSPGSRGPVESHSVDVAFGADPSVV